MMTSRNIPIPMIPEDVEVNRNNISGDYDDDDDKNGLFNSTSTYSSSCSPNNLSFTEQLEQCINGNGNGNSSSSNNNGGDFYPMTPSLLKTVKKSTTSSRAPKTTTFSNVDEIIHTPFTSDRKLHFHSSVKPTPDQGVFDVHLFSEKKKAVSQTPRCPSPPLKSTPASRVMTFTSTTPTIHHLSTSSPLYTVTKTPSSSSNSLFSSFAQNQNNNNTSQMDISFESDKEENLTIFEKNFTIICKLGSGSFSDVYKTKSKNDKKYYAVKQAKHPFRGYQERDRAVQEIKNATLLSNHENIVQYYNSWEQAGILYIQTELCEKGTLKDYLEHTTSPIPEEVIWNFIVDCCLGVNHIHSHNMLHLDIKPENLFISKMGKLKIGDFGMAIKLEQQNNNNNNNNDQQNGESSNNNNSNNSENIQLQQNNNNSNNRNDSNNLSIDEDDVFYDFIEGDSRYLAIEFLSDKKMIGIHSDIFSIGVTFFEMVTGKEMPTNGPLWEQLRSDRAIEFLEEGKYSEQLYDCILSMMRSNYSERITLAELFKLPNIENIINHRKLNPNDNIMNELIPQTPKNLYFESLMEQEQFGNNQSPLSTMLLSSSQSFLLPSNLSMNNGGSGSSNNLLKHSSSNSSFMSSGSSENINNLLNNPEFDNQQEQSGSNNLFLKFSSSGVNNNNNNINQLNTSSNNLTNLFSSVDFNNSPQLLPPLTTSKAIGKSNSNTSLKRGLEAMNSKSKESQQKMMLLKRSCDANEDLSMSPRNLLGLFQDTKREE